MELDNETPTIVQVCLRCGCNNGGLEKDEIGRGATSEHPRLQLAKRVSADLSLLLMLVLIKSQNLDVWQLLFFDSPTQLSVWVLTYSGSGRLALRYPWKRESYEAMVLKKGKEFLIKHLIVIF